MAKLTIKRYKSFVAMARAFRVIVDGKEIGKVLNGREGNFDLEAGEHTLQTGISKFSGISKKMIINLKDNEESVYTTGPNLLMFVWLLIAILGGAGLGKGLSEGLIMGYYNVPLIVITALLLVIAFIMSLKFAVTLKKIK